jgi:hypothetical protein
MFLNLLLLPQVGTQLFLHFAFRFSPLNFNLICTYIKIPFTNVSPRLLHLESLSGQYSTTTRNIGA